jgi:hypothetical protein
VLPQGAFIVYENDYKSITANPEKDTWFRNLDCQFNKVIPEEKPRKAQIALPLLDASKYEQALLEKHLENFLKTYQN